MPHAGTGPGPAVGTPRLRVFGAGRPGPSRSQMSVPREFPACHLAAYVKDEVLVCGWCVFDPRRWPTCLGWRAENSLRRAPSETLRLPEESDPGPSPPRRLRGHFGIAGDVKRGHKHF